MDRLDSSLNGQVGWRRVALIWLVLSPCAVGLGSSTWALHLLQHPGCEQLAGERFAQECEPRLGSGFLVVAVLAVLAAVPVAVLFAALQRWRAARKPDKPFHSWRRIAAVWCICAAALLGTFNDLLPHGGGTYRFVSQMVLLAGAVVFGLVDMRRRPVTRRFDPPRA
jgi:hypothetical protein